ncbi:MAG: DNA polymerase IV [Candidatus Hermodarchaeota archaeon]
MNRVILHCDLDCFFAAVEIRDNPQYKNKPVIIGADPKEGQGRGVIATCNYEARKYGLHSAMPISQAYKRCPHGIYLRANGEKYYEVSKQVMNILETFSDEFQRVGTDEAYLELTNITSDYEKAEEIAKEIQKEISEKIGITISIGIAPTKSLAKIASDENKPNGITVVKPENIHDLVKDMEITRIPGIGKKTKVNFNKKGINTIGDIINTKLPKMIELFGKHGRWIWNVANGLDNRKVKEFVEDRKSISAERTFYEDTNDFSVIMEKLEDINEKIHKSAIKHHISYRTITLKIRLSGFETYTRSKSYDLPIQDQKITIKTVLDLYKEFIGNKKKVRLLGIKLSNFNKNLKVKQTNLLEFARI